MDALKIRSQLLRTLAAWGTLLACMMLFRPDKLPVVALIVPFVVVYVAFYSFWLLFGLVRARFFASNGIDRDWKPHKKLGMAISGSLVLLLVLQSLGQLTVRDVVTVLAIVALGYLYLTRSRFTVAKQ